MKSNKLFRDLAELRDAYIQSGEAVKVAQAIHEENRKAYLAKKEEWRAQDRDILSAPRVQMYEEAQLVEPVRLPVRVETDVESYSESGSAEVLRESFTLGRLFTVGSVREMWGRLKPKGA